MTPSVFLKSFIALLYCLGGIFLVLVTELLEIKNYFQRMFYFLEILFKPKNRIRNFSAEKFLRNDKILLKTTVSFMRNNTKLVARVILPL